MKLISCHIDGFGKYRNQDINFNEDLTSFCEANGSGKSTLASYIKAMFYGMGSNKTNEKFNDRRHYAPFDGGLYGGNIRFEYGGKEYLLRRTFEKEGTGAHDTVEAWCGGVATSEFGKVPGEKIFDIDKASFERTLFVSSEDIQLSSTESMKTKLNGFIEGGSGGAKLGDAVDRLTAKKKEYTKKNGLIDQTSTKMNELESKLHNIEATNAALPENYKELNEIEGEIEKLNARMKEASAKETLEAKWKTYDGYVGDANEQRSALRQLEGKYNGRVPSTDRAKQYVDDSHTIEKLNATLESSSFTKGDERRLSELEAEFKGGVPDDAYLSALGRDITSEGALESEIASAKSRTPSADSSLAQKFEGRVPSDETMGELDELSKEYKLCDDAVSAAPTVETYMPSDEGKNNSRGLGTIVLLVVAAIFVVAGVICFFPDISIGIPIALIVVGVVLLLIAGFLYMNKRISSGGGVVYDSPETRENKRRREECQNKIGAIIMPYGYSFDLGVAAAVEIFKREASQYKAATKEAENLKGYIEEKSGERDACVRRIEEAFAAFSLTDGGYLERLGTLRSDADEYVRLKNRKSGFEEDSADTAKRLKETQERMAAFRREFQIPEGARGDDIYADASRYASASMSFKDLSQRAESYKAENNLTARPAEGGESAEEIGRRQKELNGKRASKENEIRGYERDVEREGELRHDYDKCAANLNDYNSYVEILDKTIAALEEADNTLKKKYLNPVGDSFSKYTDELEALTGDRVFIDDNLNVKFEHGAGVKEEGFMSSGQKSICMLCFRMAMIDNMYGEEKPFLIMDDPFATLDSGHMALAKRLLEDVSKDRQIIYFTCHESRRIG